jgi:hypothetical protein
MVIAEEPWLSREGLHSFEYAKGSTVDGRDCFGKKTTHKEFLEALKQAREG